MKDSQMKQIKTCFGTKEYSYKSMICRRCQFQKKCWKKRKKYYHNVKPTEEVALTMSKYEKRKHLNRGYS